MEHRTVEERPHLIDLASGLVEARLTKVNFLDTAGGEELGRLYRRLRRTHRRSGATVVGHRSDVRELHP